MFAERSFASVLQVRHVFRIKFFGSNSFTSEHLKSWYVCAIVGVTSIIGARPACSGRVNDVAAIIGRSLGLLGSGRLVFRAVKRCSAVGVVEQWGN